MSNRRFSGSVMGRLGRLITAAGLVALSLLALVACRGDVLAQSDDDDAKFDEGTAGAAQPVDTTHTDRHRARDGNSHGHSNGDRDTDTHVYASTDRDTDADGNTDTYSNPHPGSCRTRQVLR